ncbi:hypothetical protein EVAR_31824_1 [Eumeta japonica]|uniref:EF-hand domain-containing protein n=1 Tax=Eumeta variegata TaxID=151549 RepID=A0A4C1WJS6_EUMVA|nr:hypothetical protein EVAR_31824_1 [Eumeta japonica]
MNASQLIAIRLGKEDFMSLLARKRLKPPRVVNEVLRRTARARSALTGPRHSDADGEEKEREGREKKRDRQREKRREKMPVSEFRRKKLLYVFNVFFDVNQSGTIERKDFELAIEKICSQRGWKPGDPKHSETHETMIKIWDGLRKGADSNKDGQALFRSLLRLIHADESRYESPINVETHTVEGLDVCWIEQNITRLIIRATSEYGICSVRNTYLEDLRAACNYCNPILGTF